MTWHAVFPGISIMDSGPAEIIRLTATAGNRTAGLSALAASSVKEKDQSYYF
jgi:hypothetical protein